ncbi:VaFE repeat-containing surface-anchored protein [Nocardioides sp. BYT-33-1]|uniref:VaFE repeat-containing surface-anchored protein n=1 Tax=Nocardioides sp. BYT-33-1 TaxID=3416952 RepID=UPI003F535F33
MSKWSWSHRAWRIWVVGLALALGAAVLPSLATSASATSEPGDGDPVWIGSATEGYSGTRIHSVYSPMPANTANPGTADYWAYCLENRIPAKSNSTAVAGDFSSFLGVNYFDTDPTVAGKVLWIVMHSYPSMSLAAFGAQVGAPGISVNDAVEATQYAIWRYTDLGFDAPWSWSSPDSQAAYEYLVNAVNGGATMSPGDIPSVTATVTAPAGAQQAGTLVGPFTVHTNQLTVSVTGPSGVPVTDASGNLIDTSAVVDGQEVYLDLRGSTTAGSATVTVTAQGAGGSGMVISVPTTSGGTPTEGSHAQSMMLVAGSTATTTGSADVTWAAAPAPSIGTTLVDDADGDHVIPADGGTVVDTIAYQNLVVGTSYTVTGELRKKSDGSATGITGTTTFTPTTASGTVDVTFTVPSGYAGEQLVAFEELKVTGQPAVVAEHKDINDAAQTVTVSPAPSIGTTLVDQADGDHTIPAGGGTVVDTIAYQNLVPGVEYTVTGELRRKSDGSATGITGTTTFTPTTANGTVDVTFTVPAGYAGQSLVAFETLTTNNGSTIVAEHKDINDAAQTVSVSPAPSIGTTLVDKGDGDHTIPAGGGIVVDTIAYQNLTPGTSYTVTGELRKKSDGSATGITGTTTFTPTQANGTVAVEFTVPAGYAGQSLVAFEELKVTGQSAVVAEHKDINDAAQTVSVSPETGGGGQSTVSLTTETSHDRVKPGDRVSDKVTITGFVPGYGATGSATLYGPFASRAEITCTPAHAVGTVSFTPANGTVQTPSVQVNRTGYYTWVASTTADSRNTAASHACGLVSETTLVHKPSYPAPTVSTGYGNDGWTPAGRRSVERIRIPSLGVNARTSPVGIKRGTMQVPGNVARTGQLSQSAAAGDLIGTTVIAGHVSDRQDRPGAFWKLTKIRKGKVVTVRQGGKKLRYRVTSIERFSRKSTLPDRFFSTTGEHKLVLISCAGKVTTSGGGFHYRQNVVVTAVPLG